MQSNETTKFYRLRISDTAARYLGNLPDQAQKNVVEGDHVVLPWDVVLALLDAYEHELSLAEVFPDRPDWLDDDTAEGVTDLLLTQGWPACSPYLLLLGTAGIVGKPRFHMTVQWKDNRGLSQEDPRIDDPVRVYFGVEPACRLTLGQWRLVERTQLPGLHPPPDAASPTSHWAFIDEWLRAIPPKDPRVRIEPFLETEKVVRIDRVTPSFASTRSGWQVRPSVDHPDVPANALTDYFYDTPGSRLGKDHLSLPRKDGTKTRVLFDAKAQRDLHALCKVPILTDEQVATALTRPEDVFGTEVDCSLLSERICGFGPIIKRVCPIVRETSGKQWVWDTVDSEDSPAPRDSTHAAAEEFGDSSGLTVESAQKLREAIEQADQKGLGFVPHPTEKGTFLQVDRPLRDAVDEMLDPVPGPASGEKHRERTLPLGYQVKENLETEEFNRVNDPIAIRRLSIAPPPNLQQSLLPHQDEGYQWLGQLNRATDGSYGTGALLADDMGLGKTLQVLAHLDWLTTQGRRGPHLIVAPVALLTPWQAEAKKWFGRDTFEPILPLEAGGTRLPDDPSDAAARLQAQRVVLISYESLRRKELIVAKVDWDTVVLDEAQKAKDPATQVYRVLRTLKAKFRLLVTGTPVENGLRELWALYDFAVPGLLGDLRSFRRDFISRAIRGDSDTRRHVADTLVRTISPNHYIRRLKHEVLKGKLPAMVHDPRRVRLSPEQHRAYRGASAASNQIDLGLLQRLFGICAHPAMAHGGLNLSRDDVGFPKAQKLLEILNDIYNKGEKVILFANRKRIQRWLADLIEIRFNVPVSVINSDVPSSLSRYKQIQEFEAMSGFGAMVLAPRAAGVGLTICAANHVIHYTREWNPAVEQQATDRVYRIGQTREVYVYTITTTMDHGFTVEEVLADLLAEKCKLMKDFVIPLGGFELSESEFDERLSMRK